MFLGAIGTTTDSIGKPTGVMMETYTDQGTGSFRTRPVPATITYTDRGGSRTVANPRYIPAGLYPQGSAVKLGIAPKWSFAGIKTEAQFYAAKPVGRIFYAPILTMADRGGNTLQGYGINYYASPQLEADVLAWTIFGKAAGFIRPKKADWIDTAIEYIVQAVVIAGISYGLYAAAGQALASGQASAAPATAASSAAPAAAAPAAAAPAAAAPAAAAPVATAGAAGTVSTATTAAGVLKAASGYVAQAKDIIGVANVIRAVSSKAPSQNAAPSLDTTYGAGGNAAAGGSGFAKGNTMLFALGAAALAALFLFTGKRGKQS